MRTYGKLLFHKEANVWILNEIPPHVSIRLKQLFPKIRKTQLDIFSFRNTIENCSDLEWFIFRYPVEISDEDLLQLKNGANSFRNFQLDNSKIFTSEYIPPSSKLKEGKSLRINQARAVDLFWKVKRLLIADEVGEGKTLCAIGSLMKKECLPAIVVVQPHLVNQWIEKINEFCDLRAEAMTEQNIQSIGQVDVIIARYTMLHKYLEYIVKYGFKTIVMDEVQEIRRSESNKHDACVKVADVCEYSLALSGTPIVNYGDEVVSIYRAINSELFPNYDEFRREWTGYTGKVKDPVALGSYLQEKFAYIRRTKADNGSDVMPVNKIVHTVGYDEKAIKEMENTAKTLAISVLQGSFIERGQAARELSIMVRKATGISKARYVADYVKLILEGGEKVLLAAWHRDVYSILLEELKEYNPVLYTGSESPSQKEESKKRFMTGDSQVMMISLRSGIGLDGLQHYCSYVVFGELDWSDATHQQVVGRLYRDGQKKQVTAVFLVSDSGSDPIVVDIIGMKKSQFEGVFNPLGKQEEIKSDDSIIKEFARRFIEKGNNA